MGVDDGVQSHCGTTCFQHEKELGHDVTPQFLFATRTICPGCCARFLEDETLCIYTTYFRRNYTVRYCITAALTGGARQRNDQVSVTRSYL
jgi:hypothetical protein